MPTKKMCEVEGRGGFAMVEALMVLMRSGSYVIEMPRKGGRDTTMRQKQPFSCDIAGGDIILEDGAEAD